MSKKAISQLLGYLRDEDFMDNFQGKRLIDYLNDNFEVSVRPGSNLAKFIAGRAEIRKKLKGNK